MGTHKSAKPSMSGNFNADMERAMKLSKQQKAEEDENARSLQLGLDESLLSSAVEVPPKSEEERCFGEGCDCIRDVVVTHWSPRATKGRSPDEFRRRLALSKANMEKRMEKEYCRHAIRALTDICDRALAMYPNDDVDSNNQRDEWTKGELLDTRLPTYEQLYCRTVLEVVQHENDVCVPSIAPPPYDKWACPRCTYLNNETASKCGMCDNPRGLSQL